MPVIRISKRDLESLLGIELDGETIRRLFARLKCEVERVEGDVVEYEANSDRPDLFSVEGLARGLRPWLGLRQLDFTMSESSIVGYAFHVEKRPYVALAVVRDLELSNEAIVQIMQLQEKITQTYGRARRKISIGVYDLKDIKPPIYYELVDPDTVYMRPLDEAETMSLREILEKTEKGIIYGGIIRDMAKYPILRDSNNNVLSLVPIINNDDYRVTSTTRDILIDATGINVDDVVNAVTIMATSIAERSKTRLIEVVKVNYENSLVIEAPRRRSIEIRVRVGDVNNLLGVNLTPRDIIDLLNAFYYRSEESEIGEIVTRPPVYRIDVKSWVDVVEDIAIAYGYERLGREADSLPPMKTPGRIHPLEYISRRLRDVLIGLGLQEVANYMMSSRSIQVELMDISTEMFIVENPRSERFEGLRIWLAPQLLEVVRENTGRYPELGIFEIGDVVVLDPEMETRARVERRLGVAITHDKATLTDGLAYVKSILKTMNLSSVFEKKPIPGFLAERTALIRVQGMDIGYVGEVDPRILRRLGLENPVVIAEISLDKIINLVK